MGAMRSPSADICVVADRSGESDPRAVKIERFDDEDVRQMHAAIEGIIHDEDVAWPHVAPELPHDRLQCRGNRPEMARERQPLRHQLTVGVGQKGEGRDEG
jgi:hypothetical protein